MLAARGKGSPPPPLSLAWYCGNNLLPERGGVLDQDYKTMVQMRVLSNVYSAVQQAPHYTGEKIHGMPTEMKRVIAMLRKRGMWTPTGGPRNGG